MDKDEDVKKAKIEGDDVEIETKENPVLDRVVKPHGKKSREVTKDDVDKVVKEAMVMFELCFTPVGMYNFAYAIAHPQIDDKDPLAFFITADKKIIINPKITRHSNYTKDSKEGCVTFNDMPENIVQRWHKIEVEYVTIMVDPEDENKFTLSSPINEKLSSKTSVIYQHEIDHLEGKCIYPVI